MAAHEYGVFTHEIPNRSPELIGVCIGFIILTTFFFAFRQGWRWRHRQRGWDDVMAACAYILLLIMTILGCISAHYGFGKHLKDIKPTYSIALEYFYVYQICYKLIGGFTKLTFCFLYLRIFNQKSFHYFTYAIMAIVGVGSLAFCLGTVFQCTPVHRAWDRRVPGTCINNTRFWYTHAAFNVIFDIVVFLMPIPVIRTLKLQRGQKSGLISIFGLGAFVIAAATVRMVELRSSAGSTDPTWGSMIALIWTEIEANFSVICCCLPALRLPFLNFWHWLKDRKYTPTVERPMQERYPSDSTWAGPHQSEAAVSYRMQKPRTDHNSHGSASNAARSAQTHTSSKSGNWYDRMISRLDKEPDYDNSRHSSQEELSRVEKGPEPAFAGEFGGIYKTTDVHVSMHDIRAGPSTPPDHDHEERQLSLRDILNKR